MYFVFRTWNHFLLYPKQSMGLPGSSAVNNFVLEGLMSVINVLRPTVTFSVPPVYLSNSNRWKLIQSINKNLTNFILWEAIASLLTFWLHYSLLLTGKKIAYFFIKSCFDYDYWLWPFQCCCIRQHTNNFM